MIKGKLLTQPFVLLGFILFFNGSMAYPAKLAKVPLGSADRPIKVAVVDIAPFVISQDNILAGLVVDIFKSIAKKQNWHYSITLVDQNIEAAINDIVANKFDILLGPTIVTNPRINRVDYGRPFYLSEIKLAYNTHSASLADAFYNALKAIPLAISLLIFGGIVVISHLIWFSERKKNVKMPKTYFKGFWYSFWLFVTHFFGGGMLYEPQSPIARIAFTFWCVIVILFTLTISSTYTAYLTAKLININDPIRNPQELKGKKVAYVKGEAYINFIEDVLASPVAKPNLTEAFEALKKQEVFGVIGDSLMLSRHINDFNLPNIVVSGLKFNNNECAFIYPKNSPLRDIMDQDLIQMRYSGEISNLCKLYLKDKYINCEF